MTKIQFNTFPIRTVSYNIFDFKFKFLFDKKAKQDLARRTVRLRICRRSDIKPGTKNTEQSFVALFFQ